MVFVFVKTFNNLLHALTRRHHIVSPRHFAPYKDCAPASRLHTMPHVPHIRVVYSDHCAPTQPEETTRKLTMGSLGMSAPHQKMEWSSLSRRWMLWVWTSAVFPITSVTHSIPIYSKTTQAAAEAGHDSQSPSSLRPSSFEHA